MNYDKQYDAEQNLICNWNLGAISECGFVLMAGIQEEGEWWGATNEKILRRKLDKNWTRGYWNKGVRRDLKTVDWEFIYTRLIVKEDENVIFPTK